MNRIHPRPEWVERAWRQGERVAVCGMTQFGDGGEQGFRVQGIMTMSNTVLVIAAGMVMMTVIIVVSGFSDSGPFLSFQILVMTRESGRPEGRIPKPILNIEIRKCFLNPKP